MFLSTIYERVMINEYIFIKLIKYKLNKFVRLNRRI
jgi:hypothetical protein